MVAMTSYFPFDAGAGASSQEDSWTAMAQFWLDSGVIPDRSTDILRASGATATELEVFGDSTGMQVKVKAGRLWIKGHYGYLSTQTTLTLSAAHATLARIDSVVGQLDKSGNVINIAVLTGTAAGSPAAPTLTQNDTTYEIRLANIAVAAAAATIAAGNVTDTRPWALPRGAPVRAKLSTAGTILGIGVATLSNPATGRFVVTWTNAFPDANYTIIPSAQASSFACAVVHDGTVATTGCEIRVYDAAGSLVAPSWVFVTAYATDL